MSRSRGVPCALSRGCTPGWSMRTSAGVPSAADGRVWSVASSLPPPARCMATCGATQRRARTHYVEDPETAPVVRRIFQDVADGVSLYGIVRWLEAEGIPTPGQVCLARGQISAQHAGSGHWRRTVLQRLLHHLAYWGAHCAYRRQHQAVKVRPPETGITTKVHKTTVRADDDPMRIALPATVCPALVSRELAAQVHARLRENKAESAGRNPDPLATLWRGRVVCGHCGRRMGTKMASTGNGRRYACVSSRLDEEGHALHCPAHWQSIIAATLDQDGWADVLRWLLVLENVARLLADWQAENQGTERSITSRLDAAAATVAALRDKMGRLAETIAETSERESRRTLQAKLDAYAEKVRAEEGKRERLLHEAREAADRAQAEQDIRAWMREVAAVAAGYDCAQQRDALRALGAVVTIWREGYVHPDGWPQRYQIQLHFTGFTGQAPVTLPPVHPDSPYT
jgi:Recombinase/Recombinase zinc beta ribbon domain